MSFSIGVDASTQSIKAVAYAADGSQVGIGRAPLALAEPRPGLAEQNPGDWDDGLNRALAELGRQVDLKSAVGIAITCQRDTVAFLNADGTATRPAFVWLDSRAGAETREFGPNGVHEITGKPPSYTDALYKLIWLKRHDPAVLEAADLIVDTAGYLIHRLTAKRVTSLATAHTITLVDLIRKDYSPQLLDMAGVRRDQLPDLVNTMKELGRVTAEASERTGLPEGLPVISSVGDGQAAGIGAGVAGGDVGYVSLGTGIAVGAASSNGVRSPSFRALEGYAPGKFFLEAVIGNGSYLVTWFKKTFGVDPDDRLHMSAEDRLNAAAQAVPPGSEGLMCLPYFSGVLSPYWDDEARGMFYGLRGTHGMPQMYRAMLEGITYEIQLCLADLESARGRALDELVVVGGGAGSALWLQIIADVTRRPVTVCAQSEVTALGAAMHAMAAYEASNGVPVEDVVAAMTSRGHQYLPDEHRHREYQRWFEVYREIYHTNKPLLARIASVEKTNVAGT